MKLGALLKLGDLIKENVLERVAEEVFAVRHFTTVMKIINVIIVHAD
jgi:hypothetical protein